jgi:23S rRNA U2552 (ribose-2'-O)-methylase RlmE/FtsJ
VNAHDVDRLLQALEELAASPGAWSKAKRKRLLRLPVVFGLSSLKKFA